MKIRPLGDRLLVKREDPSETVRGGIIIPDSAKEKPQEGKVVAVGKGRLDEDGKHVQMEVKKGDRILMGKYAGTEVKLDGEEHIIMREDDVLAILE
ncbi:MAG: co-chaperone GroES [Candidatus Hydrogenedentes bacterium]|nr:co-chaperone GroES [Candidatus Hydrogenedentota bacterium]